MLAVFSLTARSGISRGNERVAEQARTPLTIGVDSDFPPFSRSSAEGVSGFDPAVARALCASMKRPCIFVALPFDELLAAMRAGDLDLLINISATGERRAYMDFSEVYFRSRAIYVGKPGSLVALTDGHGRTRIGARAGSVQEQHLRSWTRTPMIIVTDSYGSILKRLCAGEIDLMLSNDKAAYDFLKSECGQSFDVLGDPLPPDVFPSAVHIGVRKGAPLLLDSVNRALADIRLSGEFGRINRKYFPYSLY